MSHLTKPHFFPRLVIACTFLLLGKLTDAGAIASPMHTCAVTETNDTYPCVVGKNGIRADKKEGDGATPAGRFLIREIFYRPDKLSTQEMAAVNAMRRKGFRVNALTQDDAWVDDVHSPDYNRQIQLSAFKNTLPSHENLWQTDDAYDLVAVLGYNDDPIIKGKGSAIFMHIARQTPAGTYKPTVGCIALSKHDLLKIFEALTPKTRVDISEKSSVILYRS